nr:GtrA family protein [Angustibacter aerolatus]
MPTALADLRGVVRLGHALATGRLPLSQVRASLGRGALTAPKGVPAGLLSQVVRFAGVGVLSTLAYLALFVALRPGAGAQWANLVALLVTAVANTAANRRFTFGVDTSDGAARQQLQGLVVFGLGLALTSGSLWALHAAASPGRWVELGVLVAANAAATLMRFALLRAWVFRTR